MKSYKYKEQTKEHNTHLGRSQVDKSLEINIKTDRQASQPASRQANQLGKPQI
jgi:hypothetical protein